MLSTNDLPRSAPEAQGIPSSAIVAFLDAVKAGNVGLHSLILMRHGSVVANGWWYPCEPSDPHMFFSLSKSFTSTAIGFAVAEGVISLDDPVVKFFPEDIPEEISENLAAMKVRHLLSMSTGNAQDTLPVVFRNPEFLRTWVQAFLSQPVEHEPGTHFVYNSGATYILSAILQRATGIKLIDYLQPRLFEPLGITGAKWDECPHGINTGGWGLELGTEDIAKFGQFYLDDGIWNGKRILPEGWVATASASHVSNGSDPNNDWNQGYGFQFWRCRHNAYRGDGAYGQYCVVMPDQDAVVAITSGLGDMQNVLNLIWDHLLPGMGPKALPEDVEASTELKTRLASLEVARPEGSPSSDTAAKVTGHRYSFDENEEGVKLIAFTFAQDTCVLTLIDKHGEHAIIAGLTEWLRSPKGISLAEPRPAAAAASWASDNELHLWLFFYQTPFTHKLKFRFEGDTVVFDRQINESFRTTECATLTGRVG